MAHCVKCSRLIYSYAAGQRNKIGQYKVPTEVSMPGVGIGMISEDFHIAGIRQVVTERLKRVVMYSMALGPRFFKWKMLSLSGPKSLLFLQLFSLDTW